MKTAALQLFLASTGLCVITQNSMDQHYAEIINFTEIPSQLTTKLV